jgi:outer membrane receptor protein involved in Fe transport
VLSTWYFDISGNYALTDQVTVQLGVNNLLNQEPRLYTPFVQANTDPSTYDVLGRRFFVGLEARF